MKRITSCLLAVLLVAVAPGWARAQPERYELGRRLGFFERAWDQHTEVAAHNKAVPFVEPITMLFFAGKYGEASKSLDRGRWALVDDKGFSPSVAWAESLCWIPETRLVDAGDTELAFHVKHFYLSGEQAPANKTLRLTFATALTIKATEIPIQEVPFSGKLPLQAVPPGDHLVLVQIVVDKKVVSQSAVGISRVKDVKERVAQLKAAVAGFGKGPFSVEQLTVQETLTCLTELVGKDTMEIDYPAARQLKEAEAIVEAIAGSKKYFGGDRTGKFWLRVPTGKGSTPLRLMVPETAKDGKPLPLVIALHGLGGSENLFFEGYGVGFIVKQCQERGWLLVAPRSATAATALELIEELARIYPVDKGRVFVVGHSMGAGQALKTAEYAPARVAGVAALGGGGLVKAAAVQVKVPFFIGVGSKDFALLPAKSLRNQLEKAGVINVQFKEYPNIEHMMIVREALPDVFAMFDKAAKGQ